MGLRSPSAGARSQQALPPVWHFLVCMQMLKRRWRKPIAPCMCAKRNAVMSRSSGWQISSRVPRLKPADVVGHVPEFLDQQGVAKLAGHGITGSAEGDRANAAGCMG